MTHAEQLEILDRLGYEVLDSLWILDAHLVRETEKTSAEGMFAAMALPGVRYAEPNGIVRPLSVRYPNDPSFPLQWHYPLIRLPQAWSVTTGERSIRIAVLDSGIQRDHPDLEPHLDKEQGYNFIDLNRNFDDYHGHGTHVAGTIGAVTDNGLGVAGVMWNVDILPVKVLEWDGKDARGTAWQVSQGVLYAAGLLDQPDMPFNPYPADVINLSLGSEAAFEFVKNAIERVLTETNSIIVASAGNDYGGPVGYPAAYPGVIAVGAVDYNYPNIPEKASYSNEGYELDVVAPGGDVTVDTDRDGNEDGVLSTLNNSGYEFFQGTSMAAPHVSGVIGLMLSAGITPDQVRDILHETSMPLGSGEFSTDYGYGLINAYWAVNGVDKMRIIAGTREEYHINIVAETSISPRGGTYELKIPPGEYQIFAWVDVREGSNTLESGDYFGETPMMQFERGETYEIGGRVFEINLSVQSAANVMDTTDMARLTILPVE